MRGCVGVFAIDSIPNQQILFNTFRYPLADCALASGEHYAPDNVGSHFSAERNHRKSGGSDLNSQTFKNLSAFLVHYELTFNRVGSTKIPGLEGANDYDILVLEKDGIMSEYLKKDPWVEGGSSLPEQDFTSYKEFSESTAVSRLIRPAFKKDVAPTNVILAHSQEFYDKFLIAQKICEEAKIQYKPYRIMVFDYIFDRGCKCSEEEFVNLCSLGRPYKEFEEIF